MLARLLIFLIKPNGITPMDDNSIRVALRPHVSCNRKTKIDKLSIIILAFDMSQHLGE